MNNKNKVSSKYTLPFFLAAVFCILTFESSSNYLFSNSFHNPLTAFSDTIKPGRKNAEPKFNPAEKRNVKIKNNFDTTKRDSTRSDTMDIKLSKDSLDAVIEYTAEDSMIFDVATNKITLYGKKANTLYKDNDLTAPIIEFDQGTGIISAAIKRDSTGKVISLQLISKAIS